MKATQILRRSAIALLVTMAASAASAAPGQIRRSDKPIHGQYIVVFKPGAAKSVRHLADALMQGRGGAVQHYYEHALQGFAAELTESEAMALSRDPRVAYVAENSRLQMSGVQINPANVALDRIDQRSYPLDHLYSYGTTGAGVNVYIIDSGINPNHTEFTGRGDRVFLDQDWTNEGDFGVDCNGHGTAVAGIIGGTTYGVAKQAKLHVLRVAGCSGVPVAWDTLAALDWVVGGHVKPAVVNLSINDPCSAGCATGQLLIDAVKAVLQAGVTVVNSAGNGGACDANEYVYNAPAYGSWPIVVGATLSGAGSDQRLTGTCTGTDVDIYAPGWELTTASHLSATGTTLFSYTSAAAPVVTGAAARYLETHPTALPGAVEYILTSTGTPDIVLNVPAYPGTDSTFLYVAP